MKAVLQRVSEATVEVAGEIVGRIGPGMLALVAVERRDAPADAEWMGRKIAELRFFEDEEGRMNRSVAEAGGGVLLVSQFTLAGDCRKGRRPSFADAAPPEAAVPLLASVREGLEKAGLVVAEGRFGAKMKVSLVNEGPVTLILESPVRGG